MLPRLNPHRNNLKIGFLLVVCGWLSFLAGCPGVDSGRTDRFDAVLPEGAKLSLVVVDDPPLAAAVEKLEGEWKALTGSGFQVQRMSQEELAAAETLQADAVICPSAQVGDVAAKAQIVPIPRDLLKDPEGPWPEMFSLLRVREAVWARKVMGVPFGSPVLVIYYRPDLLEKLDRQPPQTWTEYQQLAELFSDRNRLADAAPPDGTPWYGTVEPLAPGWAAMVLLARAAPYVSHRENFSTLFRIDSMEPLIDGPPFVRALEELVRAASLGPPDQLAYDPAAVRAMFWQGRCGLALTWPTAAGDSAALEDSTGGERVAAVGDSPAAQDSAPVDSSLPADGGVAVALAELPGSREAYDVGEKAWERRPKGEDPHVPLLGAAGRMGLVLESSPWPDAALELLFWLSGEQSTQVSPKSPATTLFRNSHVASPQVWVEDQMPPAAAAQYAEITQQTLCRPQWLYALRIPGRLKYLAALDGAVQRAVRGEQTPEASLRQAAQKWREITAQLGRDAQRQAYWNSLGLE